MIPLCQAEGIGLIPWSPLARGLLAGNRKRGGPETRRSETDSFAQRMFGQPCDFDVAEAVSAVAAGRGVRPAQIALAWLLSKRGVTAPILGATKAHHLEDAVAALDIALADEEVETLEAPYVPHPILGHSYTSPVGGARSPST